MYLCFSLCFNFIRMRGVEMDVAKLKESLSLYVKEIMQVLLISKLLYQRKTLIKILRNIQHHQIEMKLCQGHWVMILVDFQVGLFLKDPDSASF